MGKRDLNNDDEGPMPKKSCQRFKDSYQDTWNFICASKKGETFFHFTVCAIDIVCLKHFVKVSAVDKGRFRFTISWHIIVSDFVTAFRRSISLLVMSGLLIKVLLTR
jgi:hypothetical protein